MSSVPDGTTVGAAADELLLLLPEFASLEANGSNSARMEASTRASGVAADEVGLRVVDGLYGDRRSLSALGFVDSAD